MALSRIRQTRLIEAVKDKRWRLETGGIVIGGMRIATDDRSKSLIDGTRNYLAANPSEVAEWSMANDECVTISLAEITVIFNAMGAHVQACFAKQKVIFALIASGAIRTPQHVEEWDGWTTLG